MSVRLFLMVIVMLASPALSQSSFPVLLADKPAQEHADKLMLFGQFIGAWTFHGTEHRADGTHPTDDGEIHFRWVLQGRAVQDVWLETKRSDSDPLIHGTTIRFYDPKTDSWRITWIEPHLGVVTLLQGKQVGDEIVITGKSADGSSIRWIFSEIKPESFRWRGERLYDNKRHVYEELVARRKKS